MISKTMEQALNKHLNEELYSFYLYLAMSAYLERAQLQGYGHVDARAGPGGDGPRDEVLRLPARAGRRGHAARDRAAAGQWPSVLAAFEAAYAHERSITKKINALVDKAAAEKDHATANFLQWFVKEQVEEEATVEPIVKRLRGDRRSPRRPLLPRPRARQARRLDGNPALRDAAAAARGRL